MGDARGPCEAPDCGISPPMEKRPTETQPWFVYVLQCGDGSLYTGVTVDLEARTSCHNEGKGAAYTRSRRPVRLVWSEPAADRSAALKREIAIKRLSRAAKLKLIGGV